MIKLSSKDFKEIDIWMHQNARGLELARWNYHFYNGSKEAVISELAYYQNSDGGFGNRLEPDSWNPSSSPYTTLNAINILKSIEFFDIKHPIYQGIIRFLDESEHCSDNGWCFSIPMNDDYPHAPWWSYDQDANNNVHIGITAELSGFIIEHLEPDSTLYIRALNYIDVIFKRFYDLDNHDDMGINGYCILLDIIRNKNLSIDFDINDIDNKLRKMVSDSIERDTTKWENHTVRPSSYIDSIESIYYEDNKDILNVELDYSIKTRPANNVWGITWSWFENNEKYSKEFAISENWWKGIHAIGIVLFLKRFNRVEL